MASVALLVSVQFAGMWTQIKTSSCNYDFHEVTVKLLHEAFLEIIQLSLETLSYRIQTIAVSGQLCLDTFWNFSEQSFDREPFIFRIYWNTVAE